MGRTFLVKKDFFGDFTLFNKTKMTIKPGLTVLVGCNGMGKSTLILAMKDKLREENIPFIEYNDRVDGGTNSMEAAMFRGDTDLFMRLAISSEGEKINNNIAHLVKKIAKFVRENRDKKELWMFFDAIDSGYSIDNIIDVKENLFKIILEDTKGQDVYIVCSANSYEMAAGENCFDVYNGKYVTFKNYDDYKSFIIKSREIKEKRYE